MTSITAQRTYVLLAAYRPIDEHSTHLLPSLIYTTDTFGENQRMAF